jgi:hypothetical protein
VRFYGPQGQTLAERAGAELDRMGRVFVAPDLSVPRHSWTKRLSFFFSGVCYTCP